MSTSSSKNSTVSKNDINDNNIENSLNTKKTYEESSDNETEVTKKSLTYDYDTDYHVNLLVDEDKMIIKNNLIYSCSNSIDESIYINKEFSKKKNYMIKQMSYYYLEEFNLSKFIVKNEKFKIYINGKLNCGKYTIVEKILKKMNEYDTLPKNIVIFTKSKLFYNKIKKIYDKINVYFCNKENNNKLNKKYILENSLFIMDNFKIEKYMLEHQQSVILLSDELINNIYINYFDIVFDYLVENRKNFAKSHINNDKRYAKILNKFESNCFLVYNSKKTSTYNNKIEWYANNKQIDNLICGNLSHGFGFSDLCHTSSSISKTTEDTSSSLSESSLESSSIEMSETYDIESNDGTITESSIETSSTDSSTIPIINKTKKMNCKKTKDKIKKVKINKQNKKVFEMSIGKNILIKIYN